MAAETAETSSLAQAAGLGERIRGLLALAGVTDVVINGSQSVWIDRGRGLEQVLSPYSSDAEVQAEAIRLAALARRRLDESHPIADGVIGGVRFNAILPPIVNAPALSLRYLAREQLSVADLVARGSVSPLMQQLLLALVEKRWNALIAGATGAGKTTVLSALLGCVAGQQRIICIEEVSEIACAHPHVVALRERDANVQGRGAVTMSQLVRAAMRMRPDRIILGECRGAEVMDVLTAMNTGHQGCWATLHANSSATVPARVWALAALAGMEATAVNAQAAAALDAVVFVARRGGKRWVASCGRVCPTAAGSWQVEPILDVTETGREERGSQWDRVAAELGMSETGARQLPAQRPGNSEGGE